VFLETEGLVSLVLFAFWIWAVIDVIATEGALVRNLPKLLWLLLVLLLPLIGAVCWVLLGRPARAGFWPGGRGSVRAAPRARGTAPYGRHGEGASRYLAEHEVTDRRSAELDERLDRELAARREREADERDIARREQLGPEGTP
jgi:hypothetical protein